MTLPRLTPLSDGTLAFVHAGVPVVLRPSHADRRRLRWWTAWADGRPLTAAHGTPKIAAAMAIAAIDRAGFPSLPSGGG